MQRIKEASKVYVYFDSVQNQPVKPALTTMLQV